MAIRIVGVDLPQNKRGEIALTYIYGIGRSAAKSVLDKAGVDRDIKVKDWTDDQAAKVREVIGAEYKVEGDLRSEVQLNIKRLMDIVGSLVCIILFSPIMAVVAVLVKKSSPGPIIFCQERVGLHNKPFKMYKFRSMGVQSASKEQKAWTVHNDPRVTPVGRIIRKTSLDELPQLFNVLKGDMSLIGPRPERPLFVEKFKEEIPRYMIKHQVRPGMTGWAQVCGFRGDTSIEGRIEHDIFYIENWTLGLDIKILFLTVFKGFINKNAY